MSFNIAESEEFNELSFYSISHPDQAYFIHQHVVDAYQAQVSNSETKSIAIIFALLGLYLYLEQGYTGKEVQLMHVKIAKNKPATWPQIIFPEERGEVTIQHVLALESPQEKDAMIRKWCESVWNAYAESQQVIRDFTNPYRAL